MERKEKKSRYSTRIRAIEPVKPITPDPRERCKRKSVGMGEKGQQRWNGGENFADAAYPRKCSGGGFGEDAAESLLHIVRRRRKF
jgi:hypothetical protein